MYTIEKTARFTVCAYRDLSEAERNLFTQAGVARLKAYAPYSNFLVGAALECEKGCLHSGCNVERCSYAQGSHAEQTAVDGLTVSHGAAKIRRIAIIGALAEESETPFQNPPEGMEARLIDEATFDGAVFPCGHCRQIIWEFACGDPSVRVLTRTGSGLVIITDIGSLLSAPFGPEQIGIDIRDRVRRQ